MIPAREEFFQSHLLFQTVNDQSKAKGPPYRSFFDSRFRPDSSVPDFYIDPCARFLENPGFSEIRREVGFFHFASARPKVRFSRNSGLLHKRELATGNVSISRQVVELIFSAVCTQRAWSSHIYRDTILVNRNDGTCNGRIASSLRESIRTLV